MITYKELKEKSREIENLYNLNHYEMLQRFMFERILERISVSPYQKNFILKGGLLLSALFGVDNRTTKDMDTTIKGLDISKNKMMKVINEILSIDLNDNVRFDLVDIMDIRDDDQYGGHKYRIIGKLENLKVNLEIDISTGDEVTPRALNFMYPSLFEDKGIQIYTYNLETILAEKIETVLHRGLYNNRMKDYYDIFFILSRLLNQIDMDNFVKALNVTFMKRENMNKLKDYRQILEEISTYNRMINLWNKYSNKNPYASNIRFETIVTLLMKFMDSLDFNNLF